MSQKMSASHEETTKIKFTGKQESAASLLAEDTLTDEEIAVQVGINRRTLTRWKTEGAFQLLIASYVDRIKAKILSEGIARVENRVQRQNEDHKKLRAVVAARAIEHSAVPGGATGLLVRQVKFVKVFELLNSVQAEINAGNMTEEDLTDDHFIATRQTKAVEEYAVDTGLLAELRQLEKHTAQELGQWVEKSDQNVSLDVSALSDKELEAITQG